MPKILVVDDDPQILKMASLMLERDGYQVVTCVDTRQVIDLIEQHQPEVILTDILMPELDGIDIINSIREQKLPLKIIAMSGGRRKITAEFNLKSAVMLGANAVLQKPFARDSLLKTVNQLLRPAS